MKNLFILTILLCVSIFTYAQKQPAIKPCYTDEVYQELVKKDPSLNDRMNKMNEEIRNFAKNYKNSSTNKAAQTNFTIPVVVYVVHSGQTLGVGANISDAQVQTQLTAMNTYFSGSGLNFCLATQAGSQSLLQAAGNIPTATSTTPGIVHVNNSSIASHQTTPTSQQALTSGTSGYGSVTQNRFLRIWVVESINGINSGIAGYSNLPNTSYDLDGVVINYRYFGDNASSATYNLNPNYQQGKVLVHEVGHYLGLRHTFEGGCHDTSGLNGQTLGDQVADTPPVNAANFGCPTGVDSCIEAVNNQPDDISNYMDYTYDACKNHFTLGQRNRMLYHLINYRSGLYDVDNLIFTGVCGSSNLVSSSFTGSLSNTGNSYIYNICAGSTSTMYFKPITPSSSYPAGSVVTYLWDFGNGITSTLENTSFNYTTSSNTFYTVTLEVTYNGNLSTSIKNIYVNNCSPIINKESTWYYSFKNILKFDTGVPRTAGILNFPGVGYSTGADLTDNTFQSINMQNDNSGNVMFFTDGIDVYNGLNPAIKINNTFLMGSNEGINGLKANIILKSPTNSNKYFIFYKKSVNVNNFFPQSYCGLRYSVVDVNSGIPTMATNSINIPLVPSAIQIGFRTSPFDGAFFGGNSLQAIEKIDGGYWIITSLLKTDGKSYLGIFDFSISGTISLKNTFLLPSNYWAIDGSDYNAYQSVSSSDYFSIAPNGNKILYYANGTTSLILDFDKYEGVISQTTYLDSSLPFSWLLRGAFSPDSKLIYSAYGQTDIDTPLVKINPYCPFIGDSGVFTNGPDGKIYYFYNYINAQDTKLGVIHKPNLKVTSSNPNAFLHQEDFLKSEFFPTNYFAHYHAFPNFINTKKATAYNINQISAYRSGCNAYKFFPDVINTSTTPSFNWNFGDPTSGAANNIVTANTPIHVFSGSGTYTVSLSINGSTTPIATTQVTITTFTPPAIQGTTSICFSNGTTTTFNSVALQNGQTVVWSITSGTGTIVTNNQAEVQISWTQLGTISALITDPTGCSAAVTKTITVLPNVTPTFTAVAPVCSGASIAALPTTSTNTVPVTGTWAPAINNTATTTYTFTPNTNYCATTTTLTITILPANDPSCVTNPCLPNQTFTTPQTVTPVIYKKLNWIETNTNYVTSVNQNITMKAGDYIALKPGTAIVAGTLFLAKIETCTSTSRISSSEKNNFEEIENTDLTIYPNPTSDIVTITTTDEIKSIAILSMEGKVFYSNDSVNSKGYELNASNYQSGMYLIIIETKNGTVYRKKLVKK